MDDFRVDMSIDAGLEAVTRFQSIKRWHMVDTTRTQSIAEHSANVALLAYHISTTCPDGYFGSGEAILAPALFHDLPEVFMGDIPTHTKKHLTGIQQLEDLLTPPEFKYEASDQVHALVKLCDLADGIRFIERYGVDRVAIFATEGLRAQLKIRLTSARANWPEHVFNHVDDKISIYVHQ
jgi:hypothetical protein